MGVVFVFGGEARERKANAFTSFIVVLQWSQVPQRVLPMQKQVL